MTRMTQSDYDDLYKRALNSLKLRAKKSKTKFGEPYWTDDGVRLVEIDGVPWPDEVVFKEAWGELSAKRVMEKRRTAAWKASGR
jgi:hypothetical protein